MESEEHVGLSDIIDVLNTLDNHLSPQQNDELGDPSPLIDERQPPQPRPQQSATKQKPKTQPEPSPHPVPAPHHVSSPGTSAGTSNSKKHKPYIKILEQPAGKTVRFRYKCEGRSAGSIPGVNSTSEIKTYPSIEIVGYKGEVVIVVSCVTKDPPYRPHPHNLVGKEGCKNGICTLVLNGEPLRAVFSNLGIQCVKKNDVKKALDEREDLKVDPFKTKFAHKDQPSSIDLNSVRLCFQAFLKTPDGVKILTPVVTDPIYDKKSISDLTISRLCSCSAKVGGGDEIIMLCEKVTKDDIKIRFYELSADGRLLWEDFAEFQQTDIHKQTAIAFKTPRYRSTDVTEKAKVFIQLMRPSDGATSEPLPFEYYPDTDHFKRKRIKTAGSPMNILRRELQKHEQLQNSTMQNDFPDASSTGVNFWNAPFSPQIKPEPAMSPLNFGPYRSPYQLASPSPQPPSPNNRLDTPSPGLVKALSAGSHTQMCDMFAFNAGLRDQNSPSAGTAYQQQEPLHQKPRQNSISSNPFSANLNIINNNNISNCDFNKLVPLSTQQSPSAGMNIFIDHHTIASSTSGGSITPIWTAEASQNNTIEAQQINIGMTQQQQLRQQHQLLQNQQLLQQVQQKQILQQQQLLLQQNQQQQHHHQQQQQQLPQQYQQLQLQQEQQQQQYQQQFQQQQQIQHDLEMLVNAATTEECPTLSGLLAYVDSEQLMNINSEDLPLSNLSIST